MLNEETKAKIQASREALMKNMSEEDRARFLRQMKAGDKIMDEDREVLKRLADS